MNTAEQAKLWEKNFDKKAAKIRAGRILKQIDRYNPKAKKILELGVGLGFVLSHFRKYEKYGLDLNKEYIDIAQRITPHAKYFVSSMHNFKIENKFDVIFSVHECINEVKPYKNWEKTFKNAAGHLNQEGLWIFDMRTQKHLEDKKKQIVKLEKTPTGYIYEGFEVKGNRLFWKTMYFKRLKNGLYKIEPDEYFEEIHAIKKVKKSLSKYFNVLDMITIQNGQVEMFVCRKKVLR